MGISRSPSSRFPPPTAPAAPSATTTGANSSRESEEHQGTVKVDTQLNIRSGPWGKIIGHFKNGDRLTIVGKDGDWYKISWNGKTAWVFAAYIQADTYPGAGKQASATSERSSTGGTAALQNWKGGRLSPSQFFALLGPAAREDQKRTGIPAAVTLAQAALETEFGEHTIGSARNLFGIKGTGPAGSMRVPTREYGRRGAYTVNAGFRKYDSWTTSIGDHSKLLNGPIYRSAQKYKDDPDQFARAIKRCGYATDPHYASKLITLMRENNLYRWNC